MQEVRIRAGYEPFFSDWIPDCRIIVDIFRASTTSVAICKSQPESFVIANRIEDLQTLKARGFLIFSEVFDVGLDNSPTLALGQNLRCKRVALRTANLTTALERNFLKSATFISGFNNLSATVRAVIGSGHYRIEIIPAGLMRHQRMTVEDRHCAEVLKTAFELASAGESQIGLEHAYNLDLLLAEVKIKLEKTTRAEHYKADLARAIQLDLSDVVIPVVQINSLENVAGFTPHEMISAQLFF